MPLVKQRRLGLPWYFLRSQVRGRTKAHEPAILADEAASEHRLLVGGLVRRSASARNAPARADHGRTPREGRSGRSVHRKHLVQPHVLLPGTSAPAICLCYAMSLPCTSVHVHCRRMQSTQRNCCMIARNMITASRFVWRSSRCPRRLDAWLPSQSIGSTELTQEPVTIMQPCHLPCWHMTLINGPPLVPVSDAPSRAFAEPVF